MSILRACSTALGTALHVGATDRGSMADLFTITLQSGAVHRWTTYPTLLVVGANAYSPGNTPAGQPWLSRSRWNVVHTMEIPTLEIFIDTTAVAGFAGGPTLLAQIQNGLFDGATCFLERVFMPTPGDTVTWGTVELFLGDIGAASMVAPRCTLKVRGKNSRLSVNTPRNVYQPGCIHTFCDAGCTLSAAAHTFPHVANAGSTRSVVAVTTTALSLALGGTLTMTSGVASGQSRSIIALTTSHITLSYPLIAAPAAGDTLTLFDGCNKTMAQCALYSNSVNFRGFPYVPSPATTSVGQ